MATVADSWEEMDDARVMEDLKKLKVAPPVERTAAPPNGNYDNSMAVVERGPMTVVVRQDCDRTQYRPNGPPQVRILKRTDEPPGGNGVIPQQKRPQGVSKPTKTYQERHAEYQEARLRIMGKTEDPEPDAPPPFPTSSSSSSLASDSASSSAPPPFPSPTNGSNPSPYCGVALDPNCTGNALPRPQLPQPAAGVANPPADGKISVLRPGESWPAPKAPQVPVLRGPKGPDGSQGFKLARS